MTLSRAIRYIASSALFFFSTDMQPVYPQTAAKHWVFFTDKGPQPVPAGDLSREAPGHPYDGNYVSARSLFRRAKTLPSGGRLTGEEDIPLYEPYIGQIQKIGGVPVLQSRWLNAASFILTREQIRTVEKFPFVRETRPVVMFLGKRTLKPRDVTCSADKDNAFDYGLSIKQLQMINAASLHDAGITGRGILIGMLDSGFRWKEHEALRSIRVFAEHDFIFNDNVTANQANDADDQDEHGTATLSVAGGYKPGKFFGAAFGADFMLGKTEYVPSEYSREEDHWVAGIEWMERYGADVVSSSVGYDLFNDGIGYRWENGDFDGKTSLVARAAARAARLGVVVCASMGNEYNGDGITGTLLTPADADSIISVGGVSFTRSLAPFSSTGPTNDGRIKPDLVGPATGIAHATTSAPDVYAASDGNSFSTPLVAGAAALVLSARPELTPLQVIEALRATADSVDTGSYPVLPNNFTGWGLVNAFEAALGFGPVFSNKPAAGTESGSTVVSTAVISRYGIIPDSVTLHYSAGNDSFYTRLPMVLDSSMFFISSGRYKAVIPHYPVGTAIRFFIEAVDSAQNSYSTPAPVSGKKWLVYYGGTDVQIPTGFILMQNYPNPFNDGTTIVYSLPRRERVTLTIYDILGQVVATPVDEIQDAGDEGSRPPLFFDASGLPSGIYFYRLETPTLSATKKMALIR